MLNDATYRSSGGTATLVLIACLGTNVAVASDQTRHALATGTGVVPGLEVARSTGATATVTRSIQDLLGTTSRGALGANGIQRLEDFTRFDAGWDTPGSQPLDIKSVVSFAKFFDETSLHPTGMSVFMSSSGNVVANWLEAFGQMIELEFSPDGIHYFIESASDEGVHPNDDVGRSRLYNLLVDGGFVSSRNVQR